MNWDRSPGAALGALRALRDRQAATQEPGRGSPPVGDSLPDEVDGSGVGSCGESTIIIWSNDMFNGMDIFVFRLIPWRVP